MIYSESYSHDVQSLNFWKVCSKTNDSFIFFILLTISGDCREALPSFPLQTSPARQCAVLGKPGGRDDRVSVQTIPSSPPAFYLEILLFSYSLIILQRIHRARHPRGPRVLPFILLTFLLVRVFIKATVREDRAPFLFLSSDRDRRNDI